MRKQKKWVIRVGGTWGSGGQGNLGMKEEEWNEEIRIKGLGN